MKLKMLMVLWSSRLVAPHVGAWVETSFVAGDGEEFESPPTWGRGLKHYTSKYKKTPFARRPPRGGVG